MASASTAAAIMPLCSSFRTKCQMSQLNQSSFAHLSHNLAGSFARHLTTASNATQYLPKVSNITAAPPVSDSEYESVQSVDVDELEEGMPKREQIFAVVMVGSRQYIVLPGRFIYIQRLKGAKANDKVTLNKVLLVGTKSSTYIGEPVVTNAVVNAVVEEQGLDAKVVVFKYKKKKKYRRNIGHRQPNTRIRITSITGYEEFPATPNIQP